MNPLSEVQLIISFATFSLVVFGMVISGLPLAVGITGMTAHPEKIRIRAIRPRDFIPPLLGAFFT